MGDGAKGRVLGVFAGPVRQLVVRGRVHNTAIVRDPVSEPAVVTTLGLADDEHQYHEHGGADQAVCVYSADHYPTWRTEFDLDLPTTGAFGENLTVEGLTEFEVCIGDVFEIGEALLQVTSPRSPCYKIGLLWDRSALPVRMQEADAAGYMLRVLREGAVSTGDEVILVERPEVAITVAEASRVVNRDRDDWGAIERLAGIPELASDLRTKLLARIASDDGGEQEARLFGIGEGEPLE
ncbi:MOSC domain-containing protein [bacterium]|nr:MOSC domain-containing protein [bacterium]